jgi:hypothetical protein
MAAAVNQLDAQKSGTLDATGAATVTLGPNRIGQTWHVTTVAVSGTGAITPTANVSLGSTRLGGTYSGNNDSDNVDVMVYPGQSLSYVWSGGTPGASVTAYAYGTFTTLRGV